MTAPEGQGGGLPERWGEALGWARQIIEFLEALEGAGSPGEAAARNMIGQLDALLEEAGRRRVLALTERNRLKSWIADVGDEERGLTTQAAAAMRNINNGQEPPTEARTALRRAYRLRADLAPQEANLLLAEETVRRYQECESLLGDYRAGLQRKLDALKWQYRAAEANQALADLADGFKALDVLSQDLTERVRDAAAEADARHVAARDREDAQMMRLLRANQAAEIDAELNSFRASAEEDTSF
ncbi:hypothetical protein OG592_42110 (plasmid) [Streptomyces avidinii]|uniref:hypothetical protein n=1 Tax=Streptomyces avidinii TaxID=1895 RepID=UPI002F90F5D2|nr:hypothetical protein OG592_42110 [Streptomyces avidinii]